MVLGHPSRSVIDPPPITSSRISAQTDRAATLGMPKTFVVKEADRNLGDGGGRGVIFF